MKKTNLFYVFVLVVIVLLVASCDPPVTDPVITGPGGSLNAVVSAKLTVAAGEILAEDGFGTSIAVSGNYAAVGAGYSDEGNGTGKVHIYFWNSETKEWEANHIIEPSATVANTSFFTRNRLALFGISVALDGKILVVGASAANSRGGQGQGTGEVYTFLRSGSGATATWTMATGSTL